MDHLVPLFVSFVLTSAALASLAAWSHRPSRLRAVAVGLSALLAVLTYASLVELLGRPKPGRLEWSPIAPSEATVLATRLREPDAIYLWLVFDGQLEPRAYVLPWDMQVARQLQQSMRQAAADGGSVRLREGLRQVFDPDEPMFFVAPQPTLPPKAQAHLRPTHVRRGQPNES